MSKDTILRKIKNGQKVLLGSYESVGRGFESLPSHQDSSCFYTGYFCFSGTFLHWQARERFGASDPDRQKKNSFNASLPAAEL